MSVFEKLRSAALVVIVLGSVSSTQTQGPGCGVGPVVFVSSGIVSPGAWTGTLTIAPAAGTLGVVLFRLNLTGPCVNFPLGTTQVLDTAVLTPNLFLTAPVIGGVATFSTPVPPGLVGNSITAQGAILGSGFPKTSNSIMYGVR